MGIKRPYWIVFIIANLAFILWIISKGAALAPDSASYLEHTMLRKPIYPLVLDFCKFLSPAHWTLVLCAVQGLALLSSIFFLSLTLAKRCGLGWPVFSAVYAVLCIPLTPFYVGVIANWVMPEALAYSFLLGSLAFMIDALCAPKFSTAMGAIALAVVAELTKSQFIFMLPVLLLFSLIVSFHMTVPRARRLLPLVCILCMLAGAAADRGYHYLHGDRFAKSGGAGLTLAMHALYLSSPSDIALFSDPAQVSLLRDVYDNMGRMKLSSGDRPPTITAGAFFESVGDSILFSALGPAVLARSGGTLTCNEGIRAMDGEGEKLGGPLMRKYLRGYLRLCGQKVLERVSKFELVFYVFSLFAGSWLFLKHGEPLGGVLFFSTLLAVACITVTAAGSTLMYRHMAPSIYSTAAVHIAVLSHFLRRAVQPDSARCA